MFEQAIEQPVIRRGLSKKGWAKMVLFYFMVSILVALFFRHLASQNSKIANREKVVTGTVVAIHKGKNDPTDYEFSFEGKNVHGQDDGDYLDLTVGGTARVFVDPQNPQVNGLRSFAFKNKVQRGFSTFLIYLASILAIVSTILWLRLLNGKQTISAAEGL